MNVGEWPQSRIDHLRKSIADATAPGGVCPAWTDKLMSAMDEIERQRGMNAAMKSDGSQRAAGAGG